MALLVALAGCGAPSPAASNPPYPSTGLVLLNLDDGSRRAAASIGSDPVAVTVSADGTMAFVADSAPGDVYGVRLPEVKVAWKQHVGGAPFGLQLLSNGLFVSLYDGGAVVELNPATGAAVRTVAVTPRPAEMSIDAGGRLIVAGTSGRVEYLDGTSLPGGAGFGIATVGDQIWTADYKRAELVRTDGRRVGLPSSVFPFWLSAGSAGHLLVAAEGAREDSDPGGVFDLDTAAMQLTSLGAPRDPDQVEMYGSRVFVAAHGDDHVLVIDGSSTISWGQGLAAVGLAADPMLDLLLVVTNSHE